MTKEKNQRTLHLVLKRKWWDMIASGEKKEEYRDITLLYCSRLLIKGDWIYLKQSMWNDEEKILNVVKSDAQRAHMSIRWLQYDAVCFHRGYTSTTMTYEFKGTSIGYGNPVWGAPIDKEVFIIKLGKKLQSVRSRPSKLQPLKTKKR